MLFHHIPYVISKTGQGVYGFFFPEKPNTNYRATKTCKFPLTTSQSIYLLKMLKTTAAVYIAQSKNSQKKINKYS